MADKTDPTSVKDESTVQPQPTAADVGATPAADAKTESTVTDKDAATKDGEKKDTEDKAASGSSTATATPAAQSTIEQSLEEGIENVVKGFGSIWGAVKARVSDGVTWERSQRPPLSSVPRHTSQYGPDQTQLCVCPA